MVATFARNQMRNIPQTDEVIDKKSFFLPKCFFYYSKFVDDILLFPDLRILRWHSHPTMMSYPIIGRTLDYKGGTPPPAPSRLT